MRKVVLTYGLIAGGILAIVMFITMPLFVSGTFDFKKGELVGYTTMVVAFSMIFFGIKSFRDNYNNGSITFWGGCKVGLLIMLLGAIMYAAAWEIVYNNLSEEFNQLMTTEYFNDMESSGKSAEEIEEAKKEWESFSELYKNPVIRFGVTMMETLPVGLLLTLVSAGILRRKEVLPKEA